MPTFNYRHGSHNVAVDDQITRGMIEELHTGAFFTNKVKGEQISVCRGHLIVQSSKMARVYIFDTNLNHIVYLESFQGDDAFNDAKRLIAQKLESGSDLVRSVEVVERTVTIRASVIVHRDRFGNLTDVRMVDWCSMDDVDISSDGQIFNNIESLVVKQVPTVKP